MVRTKQHSLKFNAVMNMVLTSSSVVFPLITVPYVSRVLSPGGMGAVSFAQSIVTYFSLVAMLGIPTYGVRACAQVRDDKNELARVVQELLVILTVSTTVVFIVYLFALFLVPRFSEDRPLFMIFGLAFWLASFGAEWFYQATEQYDYITVRSVAVKLIGLVLMFMLIHNAADYRIYGAIVVFTGYGANILNMLRLRKIMQFRPWHELNVRRHLKPMSSFFVSSVSSGMYVQTDMVLLGFLATNSVVGIYQLVSKIKNMLALAINSVVNVMLPRLSYYAANAKDKYNVLLITNISFVLLFASAGIGVAALNAESIIVILGGDQYSSAASPLLCILPALLFVSLNTVLSQYLISSGRERQYAIVNFAGLVSSICYCCFFIPILGAVGAAISCSLCEFTALVIRCVFARDFIRSIIKDVQLWQAPVCAVIAGIVAFLAVRPWNLTNPFIHLLVTCGVFIVPYYVGLLITHESITVGVTEHLREFLRIGGK